MSVVDRIQHYQRSLERCTDNEIRTLHCIDKLYKLPVTVQHLKVTGVGRTVNALRKYDGSVGDAAKALVAKWKTMVVDDETSEEEDEACVPDVPEGYSDRSNSPKFDRDNGDDRSSSKYKSSESREKQSRSSDKNDTSHHGTKHSSSSSENSKPRDNEMKSSRESSGDKYKCSKNGIDKQHTKSESKSETRRESKSESSSEKKSKSSRESKDTKSESKTESSRESSSSSKSRSKTEDSRKDSSRVSNNTSSNGGTSKNSHSHDTHRKRKHESSSDKESSKRLKSVESPVEDEYDLDDVPTQVLSRDSDEETVKALPDTSIESDSEEETSSKSKNKHENSNHDRNSGRSRHSEKSDKTKSKSRDSSGKSSGSSEKSRRESDKNEKSKSEKSSVDHRKNEKRKDKSPSKESSSKSRSHSSSSSSSKDKSTSKDRDECSESSKGKRDKVDCDSKDSKDTFKEPKDKKVKKRKISKDDGIDCNSGASFAEALGMCTDRPTPRKKTNAVSPNPPLVKTIKTEPSASSTSSSSLSSTSTSTSTPTPSSSRSATKVKQEPPSNPEQPLSLLAPNVKLEPLNVDLASTLPEISPNYRPLPPQYMNPNHRKQEESKALSDVLYTKSQRTKVYSGMKSGYTSVPTLCEEAIRVLIENIHELGFTGGIPYDIIKPVLERATPDQLFTVENYNPYLIEDTDQLWEFHCNREFRTKKREEMESSRDMYLRCREEREAKLKALTANIKESIDKSLPVRSTKLAYVDKPPRNVLRQQAKYGTAKVSTSSSDLKKQLILNSNSNSATNISVPPPPMSRSKPSSSIVKKSKAPLMAKALQLIKGRYKR